MSSSNRLKLNFVGDVMLGRLIDQLLPTHVHCPEEARHVEAFAAGQPELKNYGFRTPWGNTLPIFQAADLNLINLETSVTTHATKWPDKVFNYRMHPNNIECLKEARINYASLANNHTLDFSDQGLLETIQTLKKRGIAFAGAGETQEEAHRPAVLHVDKKAQGISTVRVFSASDHPNDWARIPNFNLIDYSLDTRARLKAAMGSRASGQPGPKVFSVHWGPNYSWTPSKEIRDLAHFVIDECGVDIIHGHSSHHIQGVEIYKGRLIIYGCGDFVDDYTVTPTHRNDISAIWSVSVEDFEDHEGMKIDQLEVFPTRIKAFQANLLRSNDPDHAWFQGKFTELSKTFGTKIDRSLGKDDQIIIKFLENRS